MSAADELRARVRAVATLAFDAIPAVWPLGGFIAANPLAGLEASPFGAALATMRERTGARGFWPDATYRARYAAGDISASALDAALDRALARIPAESRTVCGRAVRTRDVVRAALVTGVPAPACGVPATPPALTLAELVDARCGTRLVATIDERTIAWCAAFLDEGEAHWPMPYRDRGLYAAWRELARHDTSAAVRAIDGYRARIAAAAERPEDAIAAALATMHVPRGEWEAYLTRHALRLPGWAGIAKWRAANPSGPAQRGAPIDPVAYLAVRLWYEVALAQTVAARYAVEPTREAFAARFAAPAVDAATAAVDALPTLCTALGLTVTHARELAADDAGWLLAAASAFDEDARAAIWLEAHEAQVRATLLGAIAAPRAATEPARGADVVFCIDVRSEGYRRHLEAIGPHRTRGFAGFFGLPIALRAVGSDWAQPACPVLLSPKTEIAERIRSAPRPARRHLAARAARAELGRVLDALKGSAAAPFVLFESIGLFFLVPLAGRTLLPRLFGKLRRRVARALAPAVRTGFALDGDAPDAAGAGFTAGERAYLAEASLTLMGMRNEFARLVLFVGHGSTTENNPFEAALDCGACAGYRGTPNARILAGIVNRDDVRAALRERGIAIPADTVFAAADHDTATDRITVVDADLVPATHRAELAALVRDLDAAGDRLAAERTRTLAAHRAARPRAHVESRASDWAQVRPEWGLARNAAFIIAPRSFTAGADLGGRAFLHEYDVDGDADGALLEIIMTAPLIVAQWINSHYYFATVDNARYGSGTKVTHNVVGRIGVMSGNRGDVRAGLPLQSLADGDGWYHEPVRLLAVVTAPRARVETVVRRNPVLQRLFHNEWIALTAWDPATAGFWDYQPDATWQPRRTNVA